MNADPPMAIALAFILIASFASLLLKFLFRHLSLTLASSIVRILIGGRVSSCFLCTESSDERLRGEGRRARGGGGVGRGRGNERGRNRGGGGGRQKLDVNYMLSVKNRVSNSVKNIWVSRSVVDPDPDPNFIRKQELYLIRIYTGENRIYKRQKV